MSRLRSRAAALFTLAAALTALIALPAPASAAGESLHVEVLCVSAPLTGETWEVHFRVLNPGGTVSVPIGAQNYFAPSPPTRPGQPVTFPPGWTTFDTTLTSGTFGGPQLAWSLGDDSATADTLSPRCETKVTDPVAVGLPVVGNALTMSGERVDLAVAGYDVTYRWFADCDGTPVFRAEGRGYTVQADDAGKRLGATITYSRGTTGLMVSSACTDPVEITPGTLLPGYVSFPDTAVGGSSEAVVYYLNDTTAPVNLGEPTVTGPDAASFRVVDDDCESFLPLRGGCTIEVAFEPVAPGAVTAQLDLDDGAGVQATLAGTGGVAPSRTTTPRVSGTPRVGQPLGVTGGEWSGDPGIAIEWEACTSLACESVGSGPSFAPSVDEVGASIRAVVTATNDFGTDRVVTAAVGPVRPATPTVGTLLPGAVGFSATVVGGTSSATVHYVNTTLDPVTLSPSVSGAGAASFAVVGGDCAPVVAPGESCALTVGFTPTADSTLTAVLATGDGATTTLTGRGFIAKTAPPPTPPPAPAVLSVAPTRLDLGKVTVRKQGKVRTVTITNTGGSSLLVQGVTVTGKHRKDVMVSTTCPGDTLAPGATCSITLRLKPSGTGSRTANLVVSSTAGAQTVALTGRGVRTKR